MSDTTNALSGSSGANSGLINALAHPTVVNPLAAYQGALQVAKSDYEVQQLRANKAIGDILQQSTDENGNVNYEKAGRLAAAAGPVVQSGMQTYLRNASELRGQQLAQGVTRNAAASNAIIGALNGDDAGLHDRVVAGLQGLVSNGAMTQEQATRSALSLPSDPAQLRQRLQQIQTSLAPPDLQQQQIAGRMGTQTGPGGVTIGTRQDINTGAVSAPPQPGAPQGPSPETGVEQVDVTYTGPDGKQYPAKVFKKDIPGYGGAVTPPGGGAINPPGAPAAGSSGIGSGRINPTPANPALRNPAVAQPAPTPQGGGAVGGAQPFVTGPAIGTKPAIDTTAEASAKMGNDLTARADQVPTNKANYANMLTDLSKIDTMGPGTEKEVAINSLVQKLTGYGITMTPEQIAAGNSFAKLANIAVGQQLAAIGGTDARQALFMGSNPNLDLSKLGNTQIIHMLQGNEDAIQAKSRAWQAWQKAGNGPDTYQQFQNDFNHHFDPRVFQQQYMGPGEITALKNSLNGPGERQKFKEDVAYARDHGWIQ